MQKLTWLLKYSNITSEGFNSRQTCSITCCWCCTSSL